MNGWFKGPLSVFVFAAAAMLAYRYLPFDSILERFAQGQAPANPVDPPVIAPAGRVLDQEPAHKLTPLPTNSTANEPTETPTDAPAVSVPSQREPVLVGMPGDVGSPQPESAPAQVVVQGTSTPNVLSAAIGSISDAPVEEKLNLRRSAGTAAPAPLGSVVVEETSSAGQTEQREASRATATREHAQKATPRREQVVVPAPEPEVRREPVRPADVAVVESRPAQAPQPPQPPLRVLVEAETNDRAGTDRYSPAEYGAMLRTELLGIASDYLGRQRVGSDDRNAKFRDDLADGRAGVDRLCARTDAQRLLLADLTVPSVGFSSIDSAYWPEVVFTAINCGDGRLHKSRKARLEPHRLDRFEYQHGFAEHSQRFVASQAYFLK